MVRKKSEVITFFVSFFIWLALSWEISAVSLALGVIVSFIVAATAGQLFSDAPHKWAQPRRYFYFFLYIFVFLWECVKANIDVALRVIKPAMPINPGIVIVKTALTSEAALTFLANSITLTPGTLSVDVDSEKKLIYVHWIDVKDRDIEKATRIIVSRFEGLIGKALE